MRRTVIVITFFVMLMTMLACGSGEDAALVSEAPTVAPAADEPSIASDDDFLANVASGGEAIAAAHGEPHILWFWGAN